MIEGSYKSKREISRAGARFFGENRVRLQDMLEKFMQDAHGKSEEEVRGLYDWYQKYWQDFAFSNNSNPKKSFTVLGDAFESSCRDGYKMIKHLNQDEVAFNLATARRVFGYFRKKNWFERMVDRFKKKEDMPVQKEMTVVQ